MTLAAGRRSLAPWLRPEGSPAREAMDDRNQHALEVDPMIEVYKKDIDRTLLRENLRITVEQRFEKLMQLARWEPYCALTPATRVGPVESQGMVSSPSAAAESHSCQTSPAAAISRAVASQESFSAEDRIGRSMMPSLLSSMRTASPI
jgi:hypothetical protein